MNFDRRNIQNKRVAAVMMLTASAILLRKYLNKKKETQRKRKAPNCWVNPYLKMRNVKGRFAVDFEDMRNNSKFFTENFHMDVRSFDTLFNMVEPYLQPKRSTRPNDAISPKQKLAITLEYFASGDLQRHIASCYRISKQRFGVIIDQVSTAICKALENMVPKLSSENFLEIANGFNSKWNFPNCIGAIDGKHVALQAPRNAGSLFYNYKGFHSIVMLAACDSAYKFSYLDIGAYGSEGDAGIFQKSVFGTNVINDRLDFPENATINGVKLPFYFVGDDAFPLCKGIMKPFSLRRKLTEKETVFNYRLSRARRCIENAFGIMCSRWQCVKRTMFCGPDRAQKIIAACCYLHNFLMSRRADEYCPPNYSDHLDDQGNIIEGEWRREFQQIAYLILHWQTIMITHQITKNMLEIY